MKEIKLFKIIEVFNETQIKNFKLFLSSPYLNKGRNLKTVYDKLIKNYPDFNKMSENYGKMLNTAKSPQVVKNYISHLTELALDFLGYENLRNNNTLLNLETGKTLSRINSTRLIIERLNYSYETEYNKKTDLIDYYNLFKINGLKACYYYESNNQQNLFNTQIETIAALSTYFMLELNRRVEIIGVLNYNKNYDSPVLNDVEKLLNYDALGKILEQSNIKNKNLLKFFKEYYKPNIKDGKTDMQHLIYIIDLYDKVYDSVNPLLNYVISNNLWNQWVVYKNNSTDKSPHIGFRLIDKYLLKIYDYDKYKNYPMHVSQFISFLNIALQRKKFDWVKEFIKKYKHLLPDKYRKDMEEYAFGLLLFSQKKFQEALNIFINIHNPVENFKYELRIKVLQLHYELNYLDNLSVMIKSFNKFLKESEEHFSYQIDGYKLFLVNFKNLIRLKSNKDKYEAEFKRNKLFKDTKTNEQQWLIEKYDELLN